MMFEDYFKVAFAVILPNLGGLYGAGIAKKNMDWYAKLKLPSYKPPNWIFGPAWTILYSAIGYASYLVWKNGGGFEGDTKMSLSLFASQLALNWIWTPIFFGNHDLKNSLTIIINTTVIAALTGCTFYQINHIAAFIFIPYVAWLSLATLINYSIYKNNPPEPEVIQKN